MSITIAGLPSDILSLILLELPDVDSLIAAIQTCRSLRYTLHDYPYQILHSLLKESCIRTNPLLIPSKFAQVYRELIRVVALTCVPVKTLYRLVTDAWKLFQAGRIEDLLIPVVRRLALRFHKKKRSKAINLLKNVWNGVAPFEWSGWVVYSTPKKQRRIRRKMEEGILTPIRRLLIDLYLRDARPRDGKTLKSLRMVPDDDDDDDVDYGVDKIVAIEREIYPIEGRIHSDYKPGISGLHIEMRHSSSPVLLVRVHHWPQKCMTRSPAAETSWFRHLHLPDHIRWDPRTRGWLP